MGVDFIPMKFCGVPSCLALGVGACFCFCFCFFRINQRATVFVLCGSHNEDPRDALSPLPSHGDLAAQLAAEIAARPRSQYHKQSKQSLKETQRPNGTVNGTHRTAAVKESQPQRNKSTPRPPAPHFQSPGSQVRSSPQSCTCSVIARPLLSLGVAYIGLSQPACLFLSWLK